MFIVSRKYTAKTGTIEQKFDFTCYRCGVETKALVLAEGFGTSTSVYGVGGNAEEARNSAIGSAYVNAGNAMRKAACPSCRALPAAIHDDYEVARAREDKRRRRRLPAAGIAAGITFAIGIVPAILDLRSSFALAFGTISAALLVGAFTFAAHTGGSVPQVLYTPGVWFWWQLPGREPAWMPAPPPIALPAPVQSSSQAQSLGWLGVVAGLVATIISVVLWQKSFVAIYVVDTGNVGGQGVLIDDKVVGTIGPGTDRDLPFTRFSTRRGRAHEVTIVYSSGERRTFQLDAPTDDTQGWVVAPDAEALDLCVGDEEIVYGKGGLRPDSSLLHPASDGAVMPLKHSFDHVFEEPPSRLSTKQTEVRKRALRGYACSTLGDNWPTTYRRGRKPGTTPIVTSAQPTAPSTATTAMPVAAPAPAPVGGKPRCVEGEEGCSDDAREVFVCKGGRMMVSYRTCRGPRGCRAPDGKVTCDQSIAHTGEPCTQSGVRACDGDNVLECGGGGTFTVVKKCEYGCTATKCN